MSFSTTLREIRKQMGHDKARGFHGELLKAGVECNYAYYMKMEAGQVLPSAKIVEQISQYISEDSARELIMAYCRTLLPTYSHYFPSSDLRQSVEKGRDEFSPKAPSATRELSRRQISVLGRSKAHYHLFLLSTLARKPLQQSELQSTFPLQKGLQEVIRELEDAQLLRSSMEGVRTVATEHRFPSDKEFPELKPVYRQFDEWDGHFAEDMNFSDHLNKMLIRRISPRYLSVIEESLNTLIKVVRAADELDPKYNDSLIQLRLSLKSGKLPG